MTFLRRTRPDGTNHAGMIRLAGIACAVVLTPAVAGQPAGGKAVRRAAPPTPVENNRLATNFFANAFAELQGPRPEFVAHTTPTPAPVTGGDGPGPAPAFQWSAIISEESLTDEIKDMKAVVAAAVARQGDFKGGGYDKARDAFSAIALAFGVIAAYDQEIRWKKDATMARDLFARVGLNCKVGTDQSFAESKARLADLEAMLDGGAPQGKPDRDEDFVWSQVATRPALMGRLEAIDARLAAATASRAEFEKQVERLVHEAEMAAAIGEVIQRETFEFHDDATYRGHASAMRDAGIAAREAARKRDYDAARAAVGAMKKSCDACHGDYRG